MQNEKIVTMRTATVAFLFAASAAGHLGCGKVNPYYCPTISEAGCPCAEGDDCASGACVEGTCALCTAHSQCEASGVCSVDGTCASPDEVAYVNTIGTDNPDCTRETPCTKVSKALAREKRYIKFTGIIDDEVIIEDRDVTLVGDPGAKLTSTRSGTLLTVTGRSRVDVYDLEFAGGKRHGIEAPATASPTITLTRVKVHDNAGSGILWLGGVLTLSQGEIFANTSRGMEVGTGFETGNFKIYRSAIHHNGSVGIYINGSSNDVDGPSVDIANNFIFRNGGALFMGTPIGEVGVQFHGSVSGEFSFNTVADNRSERQGIGIDCSVLDPGNTNWDNLRISNNILIRHFGSSGSDPNSGNNKCNPSLTSFVGNSIADLKLESPDVEPYDYHLTAGSVAIDPTAATPATLAIDFDGDTRPSGAGRDLGADEYRPE